MSASELLRAGQLRDALVAATAQVKANPADLSARQLLVDMLCFTGECERADTHLDLIVSKEPRAAVPVALARQLLRAEQARQDCFARGRIPEFLAPPPTAVELLLRAVVEARAGNTHAQSELLSQAEAQRPAVAGECDGQRFADFCDLDDSFAGVFEVLTGSGKYYWIPTEMVTSIAFDKPASLADVLWRPARMSAVGLPNGVVYLPTLYPLTAASTDDLARLGRTTHWTSPEGGAVHGIGQRVFLVGERDVAIHDITRISVDPAVVSPGEA